ncbi:hypothetical protein AUK22_00945 [bacterium CG2_30_54_10]|nr:MAG: hypothetical protein AUK22_00945 [bacterium CG2_30_54_10]
MNRVKSYSKVSILACLLLTMVFLGLSGCGTGNPASPGLKSLEVSGNLGSDQPGMLLFQDGGREVAVPVAPGGKFAAFLPAGRYRVLLKSAEGKLTLVKRSLTVEDNLTISLLDVDLVPIPSVVSVSVPVVSHSSAFVEWETDLESDGRVDYGTDAIYGYSTFTDTALDRTHRIQLLGLRPSTSYHFRIVAGRHGLDEVQSFSKDYVFATEPAPAAGSEVAAAASAVAVAAP